MEVAVVVATIPQGPYLNAWLALPILIVLLIWAKLLTWIDKDAPEVHLPRELVNTAMFVTLLIAVAVFLLLPVSFPIGLAIFLLLFIADIGAYLAIRHKKAGLGDLKEQFNGWIRGMTHKEKPVQAVAGQVMLYNKAGTAIAPPEAEDPDRGQYDATQTLLTHPLRLGAERIELSPTSNDAAAVTYVLDGVRHNGPGMDRGAASAAITYMKIAAGMDTAEKRKPQTGSLRATLEGNKRELQVTTKGSSAGESCQIIVDPKKRHSFKPDTMFTRPEQLKILRDIVADNNGLVLLSAPSGQGLTALEYSVLRAHDAFLQLLMTVERHAEQDLEGVTQNALPPGNVPGDEAKQVAWVVSQQPDVVLIGGIEETTTAREACKYAMQENRRVYVGLRDGSTFEAIRHWRKLVGDDKTALKPLRLAIAGRTVRKLCEACKIGYAPDPTLLKKLNMDPTKVTRLYQARTTPMKDAKGNIIPCTFCNDMGFKGRVGVYEFFVIDEDVRELLLNNGTDNQLKAAFRKQKGRLLQEAALALVEQGETSVNEVQRVMKPPSAPGGGSGGTSPSPRRPAPAAS